MAKKLKVEYTVKGEVQIIEITKEDWDLTIAFDKALMQQEAINGVDVWEKRKAWYATKYKGGVGKERAEQIMRVNALFYRLHIEHGLEFVRAQVKKLGAAKRSKTHANGHHPDFIFEMTKHYATRRRELNPKSEWGVLWKGYQKKYPTKEKREQRFGERSQINAYLTRTLLEVMEASGIELPKTAFKKKG